MIRPPHPGLILLDLDNTLVDFNRAAVTAISALAGEPGYEHLVAKTPEEMTDWSYGFKELGIDIRKTHEEVWEAVRRAGGPDWWFGLEWLPWGEMVVDACVATGANVTICTSVGNGSGNCGAGQGKLRWWNKRIRDADHGRWKKIGLTIQRPKEVLAVPGAVLVDDHEPYVDRFVKAGGNALLFPSDATRPRRGIMEFVEEGIFARELEEHLGASTGRWPPLR